MNRGSGSSARVHYNDVIISAIASQITGVSIVCWTVHQMQIKENSKAPRHWLCAWNSPMTSEFPAQKASYTENVSIWWRHHDSLVLTKAFALYQRAPTAWWNTVRIDIETSLCLMIRRLTVKSTGAQVQLRVYNLALTKAVPCTSVRPLPGETWALTCNTNCMMAA